MDQNHPDPAGEGIARVAQLAAMTISVAEAAARLRANRAHHAADEDARCAAAERAQARTDHAQARLGWAPALDQAERNASSTSELLDQWAAAVPYASSDNGAATAVTLAEARLKDLHPEAMQIYDRARADGYDHVIAMVEAQYLFRGEFGLDPVGTAVERGIAGTHRTHAAQADATPDAPHTPLVDEHAAAAPTAAGEGGRAAAADASSRAPSVAVVVEQAFPRDIHQAMRTAPAAARRAITAAPPRRAITAGAAHDRRPVPTR